jgi:hypothetical protein
LKRAGLAPALPLHEPAWKKTEQLHQGPLRGSRKGRAQRWWQAQEPRQQYLGFLEAAEVEALLQSEGLHLQKITPGVAGRSTRSLQ